MIVIIDFDGGNLQSVKYALERLGANPLITNDREVIEKAEKVIFPGQGHFGACAAKLQEKGLFATVQRAALTKSFLGICVGMQLLFERSEEAPGVSGLGVLKGEVKRFRSGLKAPQMGWNRAVSTSLTPFYYFANSYYCVPDDKEIVAAKTLYGEEFVSIVQKEKLLAVQFHPEKSGKAGLALLEHFIRGGTC